MRVFLAVLLVLTSFPAHAADPLVELLLTHRAASESFEDASADDAREAAGEPDPQTLDLGRLANLQSGLSMMAQGIEAFRHPSHYAEAHKVLMKRLPAEVQPYYEDRDRGLDTLYRTLALIDYTAALRYEAPPCEALELRRALLHGGDGLFVDPKTGAYSPWLKSILKRAKAGPASETERASAATKLEGVEYDRALAKVRGLSDALQDPKYEAEKRPEAYCARAALYESLAAAHRRGGGLVEAGMALEPSDRFSDAMAAVGVVTGPRGEAAATILDVFGRKVVITSARMVLEPQTGRPAESVTVEFREGGPREGRVARWDLATDLAMLEVDAPGRPLVPKGKSPSRTDRVYAVGHPEQGGRWSVTQGLVTRTTAGEFHTDALIATGLAGGPVLDEEGGLVGIGGARMKADGSLEPSVAIKAAAVHDWTYEKTADLHEPAEEDDAAIDDWGTGSILTAASAPIAPEGAPIEAGIQGVCVAYCDGPPSSSRSGYSGGSSGGGEAIVGMAMVLGVAVAGVGYLIWQGLKALAKSMPKPSPSKSWSKTSSLRSYTPPPVKKVEEEPLSLIDGLEVSFEPSEVVEGQSIRVTSRLRSSGKGTKTVKKTGIKIRLTVPSDGAAWFEGGASFIEGVTDTNGQFQTILRARETPVEIVTRARASDAFGALDKEVAESDRATEAGHDGLTEAAAAIPIAGDGMLKVHMFALNAEAFADKRLVAPGVILKNSADISLLRPAEAKKNGTRGARKGNHVNIHVQLGDENGRETQRYRQERTNATEPQAQEMLTRVKIDALNALRQRDLTGFHIAVKKASDFLKNPPLFIAPSTPFEFGPTHNHRLDIEIRGHYPYQPED